MRSVSRLYRIQGTPFNSRRQAVETVFSLLVDRLALKCPRARSKWGVWTRLAGKVAAFNLAILFNHLFQGPLFSLPNPFD